MKWGGISSKELDEAMLLEAAMFGENSEGTSSQHTPHPHAAVDKSKGHTCCSRINCQSISDCDG